MMPNVNNLPFTDEPCPIMFDRFNARSDLIWPLSGARCADTRPREDWLALSSSSAKEKEKKEEVEIMPDTSMIMYNCRVDNVDYTQTEPSQTSTDKHTICIFRIWPTKKIIIKPDYVFIIGLN